MTQNTVADVYPLSPTQQGILFHTMESPGVYLNQMCVALAGVDPTLLRRAWRDVIGRHAALRTSVHVRKQSGEPLQVVESDVDLPWEEHDWRQTSEP